MNLPIEPDLQKLVEEVERGYPDLVKPNLSIGRLIAALKSEIAARERAEEAAFVAGWWINAATPGEDGAGSKDYFDGCCAADWREYRAVLAHHKDQG